MAGSVNKVILIGNLGKDPEIRILENGTKLARFPIATSEDYTDKTTGEKKSITEWHNIVIWRGLAEIAERYLTKGQKVYIEGKLRTRSWQDENSATRYSTEVVADNLTMLSRKEEGMGQQTPTPPDFNKKEKTAAPKPLDAELLDEEDDDLPF